MSIVAQKIRSNTKTCRGFKVQLQPIKCLVHIGFHRHDIGQRMNLLPIELVDVITEPLEHGQHGSGIVKLGIQTWAPVVMHLDSLF